MGAAVADRRTEEKNSIHHPIEMEKAADAVVIEQVAKRWIVSSGARRGGREGRRVRQLRVNHLVFHAPGHDQRRFLNFREGSGPQAVQAGVRVKG